MPAWCKQMTAASCCRRAAACFCGVEARPEAPASPSAQPLLHFNWHSPVAASQAFNLGSFQYHLKQPVGKGTHAVVWLCEVRGSSASESPPIALKLGPADVSSEAAALQCLDGGRGLFPSLLGQVRINGQKGLAMSLHGPSLYFVQRARGFRPFPLAFAWALAEQMLQALLSLNEIGMSHTDIKMQNIVLRQASVEASSELGADSLVTLVDLGSAMPCRQLREARPGSLYVQSRWYRAPEVQPQLPLTCPRLVEVMRGKPLCRAIDTWSIGCVLAEVVMGVPLFPGKDEDDMLDRICGVLDDGASAHATPLQLIRVISRSVWSGERGRNGASKGAEGTDSCTEAAAERRTKHRKEGCLEASRNGGSDGKGEIDKDSKWHGQESGEGVEDSVAAAADASAARARHGDSGEGAGGGDAATAIKGNGVWDSAGRSPQESETEEQPGQTCVRALANEAEGVLGNASGDVKEDAEGSAAAECSERRVRDADALAQPTENWSGQLEPDNLALLLDSYVELYPEDRRSILEMLRSLLRMDPTRRATPEKALHILRVLSCQDKPTMTPLEEPEAVDQVPLRDRHEL